MLINSTLFSEFLALLRRSRAFAACVTAAFFLVLLSWAVFFWKLLPLAGSPNPIPIHYSVVLGIDKFLPWRWTLTTPLLGTGVFLIDNALAAILWRHQPPLALLVAVFTVFLEFLFFISTMLTVLLNVSV